MSPVESINKRLKVFLKSLGFSNKRRIYNLNLDGCASAIQIQGDKWAPGSSFTVNLGVTPLVLFEYFHGIHYFGSVGSIDPASCIFETRLSGLLPAESEWAVDFWEATEYDWESTYDVLQNLLEQYGLPWMAQYMREDFVYAILKENMTNATPMNLMNLAFLAHRAGELQVMEEALYHLESSCCQTNRYGEPIFVNHYGLNFAAHMRQHGSTAPPPLMTQ